MTALIARLFNALAIRPSVLRSDGALCVAATPFRPAKGRVIDTLDGDVWRRLEPRRAAWEASGLTLIAWVHGLADADRSAFLAELAALTLDLREERTSLIRRSARAEAAELAFLCGADLARHWTPDAPYLEPHAKPQMLAMLEAMGDPADTRVQGLRKTELADWVVQRAAARAWVPSELSWAPAAATDAPLEAPDAPEGAGAFELTDAGRAALQSAA